MFALGVRARETGFVNYWNIAAAAVFLVFAAIQLNDPDPLYWILVYAGTAAVALAQALGRHSRFWTGACVGAVAAGMVSTAPSFGQYLISGNLGSLFGDMAGGDYVENSREFLGLLMALVLLIVYSIRKPHGHR